jgi:trans-aconitate 2-methyltransferase
MSRTGPRRAAVQGGTAQSGTAKWGAAQSDTPQGDPAQGEQGDPAQGDPAQGDPARWGAAQWDPEQYARYAGERSRPFVDLAGRIGATDPRYVVDLGCGDGELTATLARRWPAATVLGLDSSAEMLARAPAGGPGLGFVLGDLAEWQPDRPIDVLLSNAAVQWVPNHPDLLPRWVGWLAPGGWLAFQVPGNYQSPSFDLLREQVRGPRWRNRVPDIPQTRVLEPAAYLDRLARLGLAVDAWETTYLHVLAGPDPVLEWTRGTALRPVLSALPAGEAEEFTREYGVRLRAAYPATEYGTVFPFRRIFVVAHR